ncbi:hypothetical protein T492DRAFT_302262 [Pavlovales sp. CCMP2436]|nr:hypothetical protein T492DRAFT_302262 [Pavlovales sp. CCMP2436]
MTTITSVIIITTTTTTIIIIIVLCRLGSGIGIILTVIIVIRTVCTDSPLSLLSLSALTPPPPPLICCVGCACLVQTRNSHRIELHRLRVLPSSLLSLFVLIPPLSLSPLTVCPDSPPYLLLRLRVPCANAELPPN